MREKMFMGAAALAALSLAAAPMAYTYTPQPEQSERVFAGGARSPGVRRTKKRSFKGSKAAKKATRN